ncbi:hypothetical protein ACMD2_21399, partial [Ananas comosus]
MAEDEPLWGAAELSRVEVMRRRGRKRKELRRVWVRMYWDLVEEMRPKLRRYCWDTGNSPCEEGEEERAERERLGLGHDVGREKGGGGGGRWRCAYAGCKSNAMPLTRFCHPHILSDPKQTLYKPCNFVVKSSVHTGQISCGKPIDVAAVPSLCPVHFQRVQKSIAQASKKLGLNMSSSPTSVGKFANIIADCLRRIQTKRREALKARVGKIDDKVEKWGVYSAISMWKAHADISFLFVDIYSGDLFSGQINKQEGVSSIFVSDDAMN